MEIYPPFWPCLRYAAKTFGVIFISIFGLFVAKQVFRHEPLHLSFRPDFWVVPILLAALPIALALVVYVGARVWAWSFDQYGVRGRTYFGKRISIPWSDVNDVKGTSVQGIPALLISSHTTKSELFAYTLGVDLQQIHTHLSRRAGPEHLLTQCFEPAGA